MVGAADQSQGELVTTAHHGSGHDGVQAHRGEEQRAQREGGEEHSADALAPQRAVDQLFHRPDLRGHEPRVDAPYRQTHVRDQRARVPVRPQHERLVPNKTLRADEELRAPILMDVVQPRLPHHAHDRERTVPDPYLRPDRARRRKELSGQRPVDQGFVLSARGVEAAAGQQANAHDVEVRGSRSD